MEKRETYNCKSKMEIINNQKQYGDSYLITLCII